jgi:predicted phage terminase large subunit-like protein
VDPFSGGGLIHVNGDQIPVNVSMVWDPAGHKPSEQSDEHGLTVVGCDPEDHWWCVAAEGIKGNPDYVVSRVAGLIMRYRPQILGVETVFRQEMWVYLLRQHLAHVGIECPSIREIESKEAKYARISALQPRVQDKGLTLDISCTRLRSQMLDYPETEDNHDDLIDSLASHIVIATPATPDDPKFFDNEEYFEESTTKGDIRAKMGCYAGGSSNSSRL